MGWADLEFLLAVFYDCQNITGKVKLRYEKEREHTIMIMKKFDAFEAIVAAELADVSAWGEEMLSAHNAQAVNVAPFGAELLTDTSADAHLGSIACAAQRASRLDDTVINTGGGEGNDDTVGLAPQHKLKEVLSLI